MEGSIRGWFCNDINVNINVNTGIDVNLNAVRAG
jgi:hypothetical protein